MTTIEIADFGEPLYEIGSSLGEAPLYRPEDDTLHYVCPLSDPPEVHVLSNLANFNSQARILKPSDSISVVVFQKSKNGIYLGAGQGPFTFEASVVMIITRVFLELLPESARGKVRFNDGAVDCKGRLWVGEFDLTCLGTPLSDPYIPKGRLWRYDPDGTATTHDDEIYCSNGIAWSPDNKYMYYNDSYGCIVRRYDFDQDTGTLSNRIDFIDFRKPGDVVRRGTPEVAKTVPEYLRGGQPDGMVTDSEGNLWIAIWGKGCVLCFSAEGTLLREIRAKDTPHMTCPGWGGKDFDVLYCTSAVKPGEGRQSGCIFKLEVGKMWGVRGVEKMKFGA
ncbi:smp-30 cgr1 family protein [Moniliophthora roreri MCA 2997]|uniref:Smp-30 cgr1 family protein n=2 Tax=Moniliophthora roreri TaxID=221103 RepID=V2XIL2_MONRO|nr:smp-30 cgr1 family protein [Moniliophthora roreri MCA 2997]